MNKLQYILCVCFIRKRFDRRNLTDCVCVCVCKYVFQVVQRAMMMMAVCESTSHQAHQIQNRVKFIHLNPFVFACQSVCFVAVT